MKQEIKLSDHFSYVKILRFTAPSIGMMIFTSIYGVVDGFFVSNFVGKTPFAAVNFIFPFLMILGSLGFMVGTGGSALVSKTMGERNMKKANSIFSLLVYASIIGSSVIAVLGIIFLRPIAMLLGAEGEMLEYCVLYGRIILTATPAFTLQMEFQNFFITAEKPKLAALFGRRKLLNAPLSDRGGHSLLEASRRRRRIRQQPLRRYSEHIPRL